MKRKIVASFGLAALLCTMSCSGIRESNSTFVAHAESFRIFGIAIPEDDQQAARDLVPANGTITNVSASAADWTSFWGFLGNLIGFHSTVIGGTK